MRNRVFVPGADVTEWLDPLSILAGGLVVYYAPIVIVHSAWSLFCRYDAQGPCPDLASQLELLFQRQPGKWIAAEPEGMNASLGDRTASLHGSGRDARAEAILQPFVAAFVWGILLHHRFLGQAIAESRLDLQERHRRRLRGSIRSLVLAYVLCNSFAPWTPFTVFASSAYGLGQGHHLPYVIALALIVMSVPESTRLSLVMNSRDEWRLLSSQSIPKFALCLRIIRCVTAWVNTGDPLYYDKQFTCHMYMRFLSFQFYAIMGICTYIRVRMTPSTLACFFTTAMCAVFLGSCRDEGVMGGLFLLYTGTLCTLHHWSTTRARAVSGDVIRSDRQCRFAAEEVSNWAHNGDNGDNGDGTDEENRTEQHVRVGETA